MSSEVIYSLLGIIVLVVIIAVVLKNGNVVSRVQTKEQKREEIINSYKKELQDELALLKDDKQKRVSKKTQLLQKFSNELSRNIFFEANEVREIILELSKI